MKASTGRRMAWGLAVAEDEDRRVLLARSQCSDFLLPRPGTNSGNGRTHILLIANTIKDSI